MGTIYSEYFKPWYEHTYRGCRDIPGYSTFLSARHDEAFGDVKRRPKHFHSKCGTCYRLKARALRCFKNRTQEKKWLRKLFKHDKAVVNWRAHVEQKTADGRHNPHEHIVLFFDDTGSVDLPHVTNRGLKDLPSSRVPIIPWLVQNLSEGKEHYFYMLKNAFKKGGNRICTQLYHVIRAIKMAGGPGARATKLTLVADNYNENKNNTLFAFLSDLVRHGYFEQIHLIFGEVGHTHNGDDAQHEIHNNKIGQYFNPTLAHWIASYPLAWREEATRPIPVLLNAMYDFDEYYSTTLDELAGFTRTQADDVYVRGFSFQREAVSNWVTCKISVDPANGKPYLGVNNTPESRGYLVLKRPPPPSRKLKCVAANKDILPKKYRAQVLGPRMRETMEAEGMSDAMDWLETLIDQATIPIDSVLEETAPPGQVGRRVQLCCGDCTVEASQLVPLFGDGSFNFDQFWTQPVEAAAASAREQEPDEDSGDDRLPCVGYRRIKPNKRPTYPGSSREARDKAVEKALRTEARPKQRKRRRIQVSEEDNDSANSTSSDSDGGSESKLLEEIEADSMVIYIADAETGKLWLGKLIGVDDDRQMIEVHRFALHKKKYFPLYEDPKDNKHIATPTPKKDYTTVTDYVVPSEVKAINFALQNGGIPRAVANETSFAQKRQS